MIVNASIFTCSICGEASVNICAYCTKDACSNHRCERCKRCSDCCECDVPLSAEEPVLVEEPAEASLAEPAAYQQALPSDPGMNSSNSISFLTAAEASVFAEPPAPVEPGASGRRSVFIESPDDPMEPTPSQDTDESNDLSPEDDSSEHEL